MRSMRARGWLTIQRRISNMQKNMLHLIERLEEVKLIANDGTKSTFARKTKSLAQDCVRVVADDATWLAEQSLLIREAETIAFVQPELFGETEGGEE